MRIRDGITRRARGMRVAFGAAAVVLGVVVLVRPTTSLGVLALLIGAGLILIGVLELGPGPEAEPGAALGEAPKATGRAPWGRVAIGVLWIAAGVFVLAWPGLTVRALAVVVALGLLTNATFSLAEAFSRRATVDARIASALLGVAGVVFGLLALLWPDITLLVVAVVLGARLVIAGALEVWHILRGRAARTGPARTSPARRWMRTVAAAIVVLLAGGAATLSATLREASPVVDEFYAAPRVVPSDPGELIRAEPFTRGVPADAVAWRILYTTTGGDGAGDDGQSDDGAGGTGKDGAPAIASALVVVPAEGDGDWPVIDWAHGTTGFAQQCAPSLLSEPFESGALFLLDGIVDRGWALVATDYIGLGTPGPHPYLVGEPSGRATLDAVRAARHLDAARLGPQTVVWGHSQGGDAALWAGALATGYAPNVPVDGVAALAPAADLTGLVGDFSEITGGSVFASFVIAAYSRLYPDVAFERYVRPGAEVAVRQMSERCLSEPSTGVTVLTLLGMRSDPDIFRADPTTGPLGERLEQNTPPPTIDAPLLLAQGRDDELIALTVQDDFVSGLCAAGQQVDYRRYDGEGHLTLVEPDSPLVPELWAWTAGRFAGDPVDPGCAGSGG